MSILRNSLALHWRWIASITVVSLMLLVVSLAAPERLAAILAAIGLAGLMLLRVLTLLGGWPGRGRRLVPELESDVTAAHSRLASKRPSGTPRAPPSGPLRAL
jgi:hypothetical protein